MNVRAVSQAVRIDRVSVSYRGIGAVKDVSLDLPAGEILALLGPSGCGKTTLLRSVAGFVPHSGEVYIGDHRVTNVSSHQRNIGMVFQDYALFPHMTVAQNVGFGLRMRGHGRATIDAQVSDALKLVGLEGFNARMARQLSGGQQQRVALARALVIKPTVLLLDEPLSALDKKLREEMRSELKRIQRLTGVTTIFVTHDQDEALALADRLALMYRGTLLQFGVPEEVYRRPISSFVAEFLGAANSRDAICREVTGDFILLEIAGVGMLKASRQPAQFSSGRNVTLFVRPEQIGVKPRAVAGAARTLPAVVTGRTYLGRYFELSLRIDDGAPWIAHVGGDAAHSLLDIGTEVALEIDPVDVIVFGSIERNRD